MHAASSRVLVRLRRSTHDPGQVTGYSVGLEGHTPAARAHRPSRRRSPARLAAGPAPRTRTHGDGRCSPETATRHRATGHVATRTGGPAGVPSPACHPDYEQRRSPRRPRTATSPSNTLPSPGPGSSHLVRRPVHQSRQPAHPIRNSADCVTTRPACPSGSGSGRRRLARVSPVTWPNMPLVRQLIRGMNELSFRRLHRN
jgi:hypothetical protein